MKSSFAEAMPTDQARSDALSGEVGCEWVEDVALQDVSVALAPKFKADADRDRLVHLADVGARREPLREAPRGKRRIDDLPIAVKIVRRAGS